ncbi:MAG: 4-amino-4-deoxy-L-arabinose transferase [Bradyrhizobium sp.]|nr:4-amino-4-deoxy-L-arabinose transferase [Bradyrhizobium sp.]
MTMDDTASRHNAVSGLNIAALRVHPLLAIVLIAAAIRLPLAFWPNTHHNDEIFQYLEPAWRMLGHESIVSWEWRYGMRGWLLPTLIAGPAAIGDWLLPGGTGAFILPRLLAAGASLSIVVSAWMFGARVTRTHALIASFVTAVWFELVYFAPHVLGESLATAAFLPAALLLTRASPSQRDLAGAGALLALTVLFRFQYAPAVATFVIVASWRHWGRIAPMALGGLAALMVSAVADATHGAVPFAWLVINVQQNLLLNRAADFGVTPAITYVDSFWFMWSVAIVPLVLFIARGWRHAPELAWAAFANIAFHSMIGHKEYRFIFLSVALLIIVAALGSVDWIETLRTAPKWRRYSVPMLAGGWLCVSALLATTGLMPVYWMRGIGAASLASTLRADPQMCGLALYDVPVFLMPGQNRLAGRAPLYALYAGDPLATGRLAAIALKASPAFNRILASRSMERELPPDFSERGCETVSGREICTFARNGDCDSEAALSFKINDVLARAGL